MQKGLLFDEFQKVSSKAWKQKIQYDLRGADYNQELVWESPECIKVKPFYHTDDTDGIQRPRIEHPDSWYIAQEIYVVDAKKANKKALHILTQGVESLYLIIPSDSIDINDLLKGVNLKSVPVHFNFQFLSFSYIEQLLAFFNDAPANLYLNIDTIGHFTSTGNWFINENEDFAIFNDILDLCNENQVKNSISIDASLYQNSGANIVQQLAYALAHANEYLNRYDSSTSKNIMFNVSVGSNYFFEIAKIRALRWLWKTLAKAYEVSSNCHILAVPSKRNKTLYGYNVNLLRTTTECMSAVIGGANTIGNLPYDTLYHKDNAFSERLARNQLLLLKNESFFNVIENPSEGCYYIEHITEQLAEKALMLFKNIESNGGFLKQFKNQTIQKKIRESEKKEQYRFDLTDEILVGTNAYQNTADTMKDTLEMYPFVKTHQRKTITEPIIAKRIAEKTEKLRLKEEGWKGN